MPISAATPPPRPSAAHTSGRSPLSSVQPRPANERDDGSMETSQFGRRQQGPAVGAARKRRLDRNRQAELSAAAKPRSGAQIQTLSSASVLQFI